MKGFDLPGKRILLDINWSLILMMLVLNAIGLANLYSASSVRLETGIEIASFFHKQSIWCALGFFVMLLCMLISYKFIERFSLLFYIVVLILLLLVPLIGVKVYGAQRWLDLGFFRLQPSELAKFAVLLMGAKFLARDGESLGWLALFKITIIGLIPFILIVRQPDLGTALTVLFLVGWMTIFHGIKWRVLRVCLIVIPLLMPLGWFALHDYQKERIVTFLDPMEDPRGSGYHVIQSQIAIGSGELLGKGFQNGTQSQLRFLPEKHTDFAVAVYGEEWGFAGNLVLISLFCLFLLSIYNTVGQARDRFGSTLCAGIFAYFFWQITINIGMVIGLMPVVGIPLPFLSYGGTAMIVNGALVGLVLNVSMRRYMFKQ